jgi:Tfp pilus assembly protein PilO
MTARDRIVLITIATLAVLAVGWFALVSPERKKASSLATQVSAAKRQLAGAEQEATNARAAQQRYAAAYTSVVSLGKAVPPSEEVPSLIFQLAQASNQKHVEFNSITSGSSASGASSSASSAASATPAAALAGFTQMPFTFIFNGSFEDLYHLFKSLDGATVRTSSGGLQVSGRLLTLQGIDLQHKTAETGSASSLTGTVTATAYVLPSSQGLTGGSTSGSPSSSAATTASSSSSGSSAPAAPVATIGGAR